MVYVVSRMLVIADLVGVKMGETWSYNTVTDSTNTIGTVTVTKINGSVVTLNVTPPPAVVTCDLSKLIDFDKSTNNPMLCAKNKSVGDNVGFDSNGNTLKFTSSEDLLLGDWGTRTCNVVSVVDVPATVWYDKETGILVKMTNPVSIVTIVGAPQGAYKDRG